MRGLHHQAPWFALPFRAKNSHSSRRPPFTIGCTSAPCIVTGNSCSASRFTPASLTLSSTLSVLLTARHVHARHSSRLIVSIFLTLAQIPLSVLSKYWRQTQYNNHTPTKTDSNRCSTRFFWAICESPRFCRFVSRRSEGVAASTVDPFCRHNHCSCQSAAGFPVVLEYFPATSCSLPCSEASTDRWKAASVLARGP